MNKRTTIFISTVLLAFVFASCTKKGELKGSDLPIELSYSVADPASRVDDLAANGKVGLFGVVDGSQSYFMRNALFSVGSDGRTIQTLPIVYYPDAKQAVNFYAYLPYQAFRDDPSGVGFVVPTDQTTSQALKAADLLWAQTSSVPLSDVVPLVFRHRMARVVVQVVSGQVVDQVTMVEATIDGKLNVVTGAFALGSTKLNVRSTNLEFIIPAQVLPRLVITVSGVDYIFEPTSAIALQAASSNTFALTLNPISQTAMLTTPTSIVTDWSTASASGGVSEVVGNQFLAHWLVADYRFNQINRIDLTIKDNTSSAVKDYMVSGVALVSGSTIAAASYTFDLKNVPELHYPYTVSAIKFYKDATLVHTAWVSNTIPKNGGATLGWSQDISLTVSAPTASVGAQVTSSSFTLTSNVPYLSSYTTGGSSVQGSGAQPPYLAQPIVFAYPAQGSVATVAKTHTMTITPTVDYTGALNKRTFTVSQAAVPCTFSLSAYSANVDAQATSAAFTLSSNAPYSSSYSSGGSSAQGMGNAPPYTNLGVTLNFPAQGSAPAAARSHIMTVTQSATAALSPKSGTFTVTQAAVAPALTLSPYAPGVTIPKAGATYYTNITSNTTWSASASNATVTTSGSGNVTNFAITANSTSSTSTRTVSVTLTTTTNAGQSAISRTWSGTQEAIVVPSDCFPTALPSYPLVFVVRTDNDYINWEVARNNCAARAARLPTKDELVAMYNAKANYGEFVDFYYWSSTPSNGSYNIVSLVNGHVSTHTYPTYYANVRCVKDA